MSDKVKEMDLKKKIGLVGTITSDNITFEEGRILEGLGGILYQAAVLCGLGKEVSLFTNLGEELVQDVDKVIQKWPSLEISGIIHVPGPGNRVNLHYPKKGERIEILESVVPPLDPVFLISTLPQFDFLVSVFNSGFDVKLENWREIVKKTKCPIWLDIHSLVLEKKFNYPRKYISFSVWKEWVSGVTFLQANKKEVASMLGYPERTPTRVELEKFGKMALDMGVEAVFITLGKDGLLVLSSSGRKGISAGGGKKIMDTTGCGDVFCGAAAAKLVEGTEIVEAVEFASNLATRAAGVAGIRETYDLVTKNGTP